MSFQDNLNKILERQKELSDKLSSGIMGEEFVKASKEYSELEPIVENVEQYNKVASELAGAKEMLAEGDLDSETKDMVEEEIRELNGQLPELEHKVKIALCIKVI